MGGSVLGGRRAQAAEQLEPPPPEINGKGLGSGVGLPPLTCARPPGPLPGAVMPGTKVQEHGGSDKAMVRPSLCCCFALLCLAFGAGNGLHGLQGDVPVRYWSSPYGH